MDNQLDERAFVPQTEHPPRGRRTPRGKMWLAAAVLVPVLAVVGAYALFFTPDSPGELRLSDKAADAGQVVRSGTWVVGEGSVAGYRVREKLLRLPSPNDAVGRTNAVSGQLRLSSEPAGIRIEPGMHIDVDVTTLDSDEDRRDEQMRTRAIETDKFPVASFVTASPIFLPAGEAADGEASVTVDGDLTLHGVTKPVSIPVHAQHVDGRIEVVGSFTFGWDLFGMEQPNLSFVTVESDPAMEFQVFFDHAPAS